MGMTTDVHVRELRYFATVAEELHFTRAAELLYVSQPALSKQIRALERQLGAELFHRGPRGVTLTEAGTALLPHARRMLADWTEGAAAVEAARAARRDTLVVGMSTSPGRGGLLPAIRSRFTAAHPEAVLQLRQMSWEDPTAGLADGTADVAYVWLPLPDADRYAWTVVAEEPRLVALPDSHPSPPARRSTSPTWPASRSSPCPRRRASCATSGWRWTNGAHSTAPPPVRRASAPRSPARRRRTRPWSPGSASAWWPRATPR